MKALIGHIIETPGPGKRPTKGEVSVALCGKKLKHRSDKQRGAFTRCVTCADQVRRAYNEVVMDRDHWKRMAEVCSQTISNYREELRNDH